MKYLIFGGSGFIGTHLVNILKNIDNKQVIYNLDIVEENHGGKSAFVFCDVRNKIELNIPIASDDVIFNLAAVHKTPGHLDNEYFETNIRGAENVCDFAEQHGIKTIIFTSSIAPYGAAEELKKESTIPMPNVPYGISKLTAEKIHQIWQAKDNTREVTILRPGVVFGKGEGGNFTRLYWGIKDRKFFYPGRKDTIKACIYVKELVYFMIYQLHNHNGGVEIFNCTFKQAFTIEQIVETMKKVTKLKRHIIKINGPLLKTAASILGLIGGKQLGIHPERVKKLMISTNICGEKLANSGYKFKYTLEEAIADWYKDNDCKCLK
jgi:nucleoside-diphosphate-sugar epimerase